MNTLRLVPDWAEPTGPQDAFYHQQSLIYVSSEWTVEEAAVLLGLTKDGDWHGIIQDYGDGYLAIGVPYTVHIHFFDYLKALISLSLAHEKSGLSLEKFIEGMTIYKEG